MEQFRRVAGPHHIGDERDPDRTTAGKKVVGGRDGGRTIYDPEGNGIRPSLLHRVYRCERGEIDRMKKSV